VAGVQRSGRPADEHRLRHDRLEVRGRRNHAGEASLRARRIWSCPHLAERIRSDTDPKRSRSPETDRAETDRARCASMVVLAPTIPDGWIAWESGGYDAVG
jgi:hypothetical protein